MNGLKKFMNLLFIIIGIVFIAVCVDLVTNKTINTSYEKLDELDQNALSDICEIIYLFDDKKGNKDIWDIKYNLRDIGCVITNTDGIIGGHCYAVNVDLSGNAAAQKIEMPDDYSDIPVYRFSDFAPQTFSLWLPFNEKNYITLNGKSVFSIKYTQQTADFKGAGSLKESYVKTTFGDAVESEDCPNADVGVSFDMDEENIALLGLQYRIIDDMRNVKTKNELNELIAEYVIVRDYQAELYPDFDIQKQRIELVDGKAQYVFYQISDLIGDDMTYFNKEKDDSITFYSAYHYLCTGHYNDDVSEFLDYKGDVYVGAALCEILNNNSICSDWENKLDNSSNSSFLSQYTLFKNYCSEECGEYSDKTLDDIKREYSYEQILEMARALVEGNAE